jgi:hypothetical protein
MKPVRKTWRIPMLKHITLSVSNAHAIRGVVCDDGNVMSGGDFAADDACADECTKPKCGGVLMSCYHACMDKQEDASHLLPWQGVDKRPVRARMARRNHRGFEKAE